MTGKIKPTDLPKLTDRVLSRFTIRDAGWSGERARLSESDRNCLLTKLQLGMTVDEANEVVRLLERAFGEAVELAKFECLLRRAVGADGHRTRSRKLGVQLRDRVQGLMAELEADASRAAQICSLIREDTILDRLISPLLEERLGPRVIDPLRDAPDGVAEHLPDVLGRLHDAIRAGITTGPVEPSLDFLARAVVVSMARVTGRVPGRTWIEVDVEETGAGLEACRVLAAALNDALSDSCRRERPADMAKAFRRAIKAIRSEA